MEEKEEIKQKTNNITFIKKQINTRKWALDCGGKQDLDMPILQISTRYYPDFTAIPSFILCDDTIDDDYSDYKLLLAPKDYIRGISEEDCKIKVKQWYIENLRNAIEMLLK